jgi:hypothetical protein
MAQKMGIGKKEFLEDYYPDETLLYFRRNKVLNDRAMKDSNMDKKEEKTQEVYWDHMGI